MKAGDVALVGFPFSGRASVSFKKRPVLVLCTFGAVPDEVVWTVMITGSLQRVETPGPGDIAMVEWQAAGLAKASVIRTRRVWTAEQRDVLLRIGQVSTKLLDTVRLTVQSSLDF